MICWKHLDGLEEKMSIGIISLGISNVKSVQNMLRKAGAQSIISDKATELQTCKKLILPGVGSFDAAMRKIAYLGIGNFLKDYAHDSSNQLMGICLGMQLFAKSSQEGSEAGLGLIDADVLKFQISENHKDLKVPNMGWRESKIIQRHPIVTALDVSRFYFVHSYYMRCNNPSDILMSTLHGIEFTSAVVKENIYGFQFHPEKSHRFGYQIMKNFVELKPI